MLAPLSQGGNRGGLLLRIMFNCDGAFKSSCSAAAFGIIARDNGGLVQIGRCGKITSMIFFEGWALQITCAMAVDMGLSDAIFELDCKVVIDCLKSDTYLCPWEISALVEDI